MLLLTLDISFKHKNRKLNSFFLSIYCLLLYKWCIFYSSLGSTIAENNIGTPKINNTFLAMINFFLLLLVKLSLLNLFVAFCYQFFASFLDCSLFSYCYSNYCYSDSCRSFKLFEVIAINILLLFSNVVAMLEERQLCTS